MEDIQIPAMAMLSATDGERDLKKQMGCMNGIFHLFDPHHFTTGRRVSSNNHKRLFRGQQQGPDNREKGPQLQKLEKPRMSTESSQASCSSSTCSTSTFSSIDCNRIAQPEALSQGQSHVPESPFPISATKEEHPPLTKTVQPLYLRDIVKDSIYRDARGLSIKHLGTDEIRGTVMKQIDSPRPSQQLKPGKPKANGFEGSKRALVKEQGRKRNSKEDRLALPRLSYDGRESRETIKSGMKHKEIPRLSLDGKLRSLKNSAGESRLNFLSQDKHMETESSSQALSSNRSSSIVAKLMGLETLQPSISLNDGRTQTSGSSPEEACFPTSSADKSRQNQPTYSPCAPNGNHGTSSSRLRNPNSARKLTTCSKLPVERAPWSQQDHRKGSPPTNWQNKKPATSASHLSSSIYGEIEKRITELEFKQSGKDLRALKQILEAMEKTRERLENQRGESSGPDSLEDSYSAQSSIRLLIRENEQKSCRQVSTVKGPAIPRQLGSSNLIMKPDKMKGKFYLSTQAPAMERSQLRRLQTRAPIYHREISAHKPEAKHCTKNNNVKDLNHHLPGPHKKTVWWTSELRNTSGGPHCMTVENSTSTGRSFGMSSPRLQQNPLRMEEQSHPTIQLLDAHCFQNQSSNKFFEKSCQNRKQKRVQDLQLSYDQLSEISSSTRGSSCQGDVASVKSESNNSQLSQTEREVISLANSSYENARQKEKSASITRTNMAAVESVATLLEQPSPSSVLDDTYHNEDLPSPVEKTSTGFQDKRPSPGEAEWDLKKSKHSTACRRYDQSCKYNQKLKNLKPSSRELNFLHTELDKIAATYDALANVSCSPDHRYITKILLTSGILKDSNVISTTDQVLPSCHLINPDIFHVLEQTEDIMDLKNDSLQLNNKLQRRIIFDLVDEILVRKNHLGRYSIGKKNTSPEAMLKEVYSEMDHLSSISVCNLDNAEEAKKRLLTASMFYQSEDWADCSGEFPALVLDIERQIFKDLINGVISGEVMSLHDRQKSHCRQLFSQ